MSASHWTRPTPESTPTKLHVYNSLTNQLNEFIPIDSHHVKMYICGPTVYDSAHLGHARAYITFDIIRRIIQSYFNYSLQYTMNITDVDDKIIVKARRNYLYQQYIQKHNNDIKHIISECATAFTQAINSQQSKITALQHKITDSTTQSRYIDEYNNTAAQETLKLQQLQHDHDRFQQHISSTESFSLDLINEICRSVLCEKLDTEYGDTITDQSIYRAHAAKYEAEFFDDMKQLNVLPPDTLTRVTEYIDDIIQLVQKIIANGYGYISNGSVYLDTNKYTADGNKYGVLAPNSVGNTDLIADGEGSLTSTTTSDKRSINDFVLWKKSKLGEPYWNSPWGNGRPGWHIECFANDTRVLTNHGYLFVEQIEHLLSNNIPVQYACYDVAST